MEHSQILAFIWRQLDKTLWNRFMFSPIDELNWLIYEASLNFFFKAEHLKLMVIFENLETFTLNICIYNYPPCSFYLIEDCFMYYCISLSEVLFLFTG